MNEDNPSNALATIANQLERGKVLTPSRELAVSLVQAAARALDDTNDIDEVKDIHDKLRVFEVYFKKQHAERIAANEIVYQRIRTIQKLGGMLAAVPGGVGSAHREVSHNGKPYLQFLREHEIPTSTAYRWQYLADNLDDEDWRTIKEEAQTNPQFEASVAKVIGFLMGTFVAQNAGEQEWFTPPEYIAAAREVMGEIDLDPASCDKANKIVGAKKYYTKKDDGLTHDWAGRVWMNPPYASELIDPFAAKFAFHVKRGDIEFGIVLVNNSTETQWFSELIEQSAGVVFPSGRVKFLDPQGNPGSPLQGQACIYFGPHPDKFLQAFSKFGWGAALTR